MIVAKAKNRLVGAFHWKSLTVKSDFVAQLYQQKTEVVRNVMIQQELHSAPGAIWRATKRSISPRWSS